MLCAKYINEYIEISKSHLDYIYTFLRCGSVTKTTLALFLLHSSSGFFFQIPSPSLPQFLLWLAICIKSLFSSLFIVKKEHILFHTMLDGMERERERLPTCAVLLPVTHAHNVSIMEHVYIAGIEVGGKVGLKRFGMGMIFSLSLPQRSACENCAYIFASSYTHYRYSVEEEWKSESDIVMDIFYAYCKY